MLELARAPASKAGEPESALRASDKLAPVVALVILVISVGLVDSLNPSTIAPALYLATGKNAVRSLAGFTAGAFGVNLAGGVLLLLGPGRAIVTALPRPGGRTIHVAELCLGAGALVVALALWLARERVARRVLKTQGRVSRSSALVGAAIMAVELPTAFPYFAVIAVAADSGRTVLTQIALLVVFNLAFVAPLAAIVAIVSLAEERGARRLELFRTQLERRAAVLVPSLVLLVGVALILLGGIGLLRG